MNKQKTIIGFSLMLSLVLSLSVFASEKIETRAALITANAHWDNY